MSDTNAPSSGESNISGLIRTIEEGSRLRDDVSDFVRDVTSAGTFDLERESDSRLTAFEVALKYVPADKLPDLVKDLGEYVQSSPELFSETDSDIKAQLSALKESAGVDS